MRFFSFSPGRTQVHFRRCRAGGQRPIFAGPVVSLAVPPRALVPLPQPLVVLLLVLLGLA